MKTYCNTPLVLFVVFTLLVSACGVAPWADERDRAQATLDAAKVLATAASIKGTAAALLGTPGGPMATQVAPAPGATYAPGATQQPAGNCQDGAATGNPKNKIDRTPVGLAENFSVQEVSVKPGKGFAGFDRWVQIVPPLGNKYQVFDLNVETIHEVKYCGTADQVAAFLKNPATHVQAMRQSAADSAGNIPPVGEIPVVGIDVLTGNVGFLVAPTAPTAPTLATIKSHIEVVKLGAPALNTNPLPQPQFTAQAQTATQAALCGPATEVDLGPWETKDRNVSGRSIVNIGFPGEGTTMYRTLIPNGVNATFFAAAGKAWKFEAGCPDSEIQRQLTASANGITVVTLDELIAKGKAKK